MVIVVEETLQKRERCVLERTRERENDRTAHSWSYHGTMILLAVLIPSRSIPLSQQYGSRDGGAEMESISNAKALRSKNR